MLSFLPKMGLRGKDYVPAADTTLGQSILKSCAVGYLMSPISLKAASQGRWLEHLPSLHWYSAIPSSWVNLVLFAV